MNLSEKLDLAIKLNETGTTDGSYTVPYKNGTRSKPTYMTNEEWNSFLATMPDEARNEYDSGDKLKEKDGHPPKMASFGSSCRMIYNLSSKKEGFHFEKKLPATIGGTTELGGFYEDAERYIFVEAKCNEPYTAKNVSASKVYEKLYKYINEQMFGNLHINMEISKCGRYLNVEYFADGEKLERFDMKQMICHLLGIATGMLNGTLERKQTDFIYLLFDPTEFDMDPDDKEMIDEIYGRTCYECNLVDFAELYRVILDFLRNEKYTDAALDTDIYDMMIKFTFTLASQDFYPILPS